MFKGESLITRAIKPTTDSHDSSTISSLMGNWQSVSPTHKNMNSNIMKPNSARRWEFKQNMV